MKFSEFKEKTKYHPLFGGDMAGIFNKNPQTLRNQFLRWKKKGLIIKLKKGLYVLSRKERTVFASKEFISSNLYRPSYVSMETALSYYKLIPEKVIPITSVTTRKTKTFQNDEGLFIYRHLKKSAYFGFKLMRDEYGFPYFLAEPEKALIDYIYFNLGSIKADDKNYFNASLRLQNRLLLNKTKFLQFAKSLKIKKLIKAAEQLI